MIKPRKGIMPRITLLLVVALLAMTLLAACDVSGTKAPDGKSTGDESAESESLPGDTDFVTGDRGTVLGSPGSYNIFIQITGITGESIDDAHEDWIDILSYSHGVSRLASSGESRSTGDATHLDFTITKELDKASPKLALYCCNSAYIEEVTIELCYANGDKDKFMEYVLTDVVVTSVIVNGSAGSEDRPVEEVSFKYGSINWIYTEYDEGGMPKGNVESYWDVELDKSG